MTKITHVAILYENKIWSLPKPNRHHHIIKEIYDSNGIGIISKDIQGFLDSNGNFLTREEALEVARNADQLLDPKNVRLKKLFSEDIW